MSYKGLVKKYWRVGGPEHLEMWCIKNPWPTPPHSILFDQSLKDKNTIDGFRRYGHFILIQNQLRIVRLNYVGIQLILLTLSVAALN